MNCGAETKDNFCSNCGQSTSVHRITVRETWSNFLSSSFSIEGAYFITLKTTIVNPGRMFREFIEGKRKKYYKPVAFFILNVAIYMVVRVLIGYDPLAGQDAIKELQANSSELSKLLLAASQVMVSNPNKILFLMVFSISITMKTFYAKRYNFAEYLSIGFYITSFFVLFNVFSMLISNYIGKSNYSSLIVVILAIQIFYSSFSFFQDKSFVGVLKNIAISVISILLYMILGYGISFLWVFVFR